MSLLARVRVARPGFCLDVEVQAEAGSTLAVLGSNGAGKSTLLGAIAGTVPIDDGEITLEGRTLDAVDGGHRRAWVPPHRRRVGVVPQDTLLFPHLSVADNIGFGPRAQGADAAAADAVAAAWLDRLDLRQHAHARPASLSGGQAQRVALARALATEPAALALDEPLSALDATTRQTVRRDLRRWLDDYPGVALVVTHDPLDALMLAQHVAVVEDGRTTQFGSVAEVAARPRTPYVADLLGTNLLRGTATGRTVAVPGGEVQVGAAASGDVLVTISPRAITVHRAEPSGSARNRWAAPIDSIDQLGDRVRIRTGAPLPLTVEISPEALATMDLQVGERIWLAVKATDLTPYPC